MQVQAQPPLAEGASTHLCEAASCSGNRAWGKTSHLETQAQQKLSAPMRRCSCRSIVREGAPVGAGAVDVVAVGALAFGAGGPVALPVLLPRLFSLPVPARAEGKVLVVTVCVRQVHAHVEVRTRTHALTTPCASAICQ